MDSINVTTISGFVSDRLFLSDESAVIFSIKFWLLPLKFGTLKKIPRQDIGKFKNTSRPSSGKESNQTCTALGFLE